MVIDESPDLILLKDGDGRFMLCNAALAHLYGTTPEQLVGKDDAALPGNTGRIGLGHESVRSVTYGDSVQIVEENALDAETG